MTALSYSVYFLLCVIGGGVIGLVGAKVDWPLWVTFIVSWIFSVALYFICAA